MGIRWLCNALTAAVITFYSPLGAGVSLPPPNDCNQALVKMAHVRAIVDSIAATQNPLAMDAFLKILRQANFRTTFAPDQIADGLLAWRTIVTFVKAHPSAHSRDLLSQLRTQFSDFYFHGMHTTPNTNDLPDFHASMIEVDRIFETLGTPE